MKYVGKPVITFQEFPDEIALNFSISGCPNNCLGCSEPELSEDIGEALTFDAVSVAICQNPGITLIGFQGGDQDHDYLVSLITELKAVYTNLKFGMYSGRNYLDSELLKVLDYYKIGEWRMPVGNDSTTWFKTNCGPINFTFSNQLMFKRVGNNWLNITDKFRTKPIVNYTQYIIK